MNITTKLNPFHIRVLSWLLFFLLVYSSYDLMRYSAQYEGVDFYQFWAVSQTHDQLRDNNIYSEESRRVVGQSLLAYSGSLPRSSMMRKAAEYRTVLETYSSPFLYTALAVFGLENYDLSLQIFRIFSLLLGGMGIIAICHRLKLSSIEVLLFLVFLTSWFMPISSELRTANVNLIQLGIIGIAYYIYTSRAIPNNVFIAGVLISSLVSFKPNTVFIPFFLLLWLLLRRENKELLRLFSGLVAGALGSVLLSILYFGHADIWVMWIRALANLPESIITIEMGNFSLNGYISAELNIHKTALPVIVILFSTGSLVFANIRSANEPAPIFKEKDIPILLYTGLGCLVYLLSSPLVWAHYYILAIPSILTVYKLAKTIDFKHNLTRMFFWMFLVTGISCVAFSPAASVIPVYNAAGAATLMIAGVLIIYLITLVFMIINQDLRQTKT